MGDSHILIHMAEAIIKRYWEAGKEHNAEALGVEGRRASEVSNYRVAHHNISLFFEGM